jgi:hypothetical protein
MATKKKTKKKKSTRTASGLTSYRRFVNGKPAVKAATKRVTRLERDLAAAKKKKAAAKKVAMKAYKKKKK